MLSFNRNRKGNRMKQLIDRISAQLERLKRQYPEASVRHEADFSLNKGAGEADFAELEKELGYALPEDFKELYRIADGGAAYEGVLAGEEWLSVERIIEEYGVWKGLYEGGMLEEDDGTPFGCEPKDAGIKPDFCWNPKWIPLTADGCGNGKMIDLDPTGNGTVGQIIQMWHDDSAYSKEAESLRDFFARYAQDLEDGKYVLSADYGLILQSELDELA